MVDLENSLRRIGEGTVEWKAQKRNGRGATDRQIPTSHGPHQKGQAAEALGDRESRTEPTERSFDPGTGAGQKALRNIKANERSTLQPWMLFTYYEVEMGILGRDGGRVMTIAWNACRLMRNIQEFPEQK